MSLPREHSVLADRLTDVATLIGERQPDEVELLTGKRVIPGLGLQNEATWLTQKAGQLRSGALKMVVCGGVSAGKSTLISAITGTKLPVGAQAKTGVICEVVSGSNADTFVVFYADGREISMDLDAFTSFSSLKSGNIKSGEPFPLSSELSQVLYARTESSSAFSESGITIVDTLGFNAGRLAEDITSNHLQTADVVLMALGSRPAFTQTDVDFFQERLDGLDESKKRNLLYVINDFSLTERERAEVLTGARDKLAGLVKDFDREVFIVNAVEALVGRYPDAADRDRHDELLAKHNGDLSGLPESSGLVQLERVIEESLESNEAWRLMQEAAVNDNVRPALGNARDNIVRRRSGLTADASELEEAVAEARDAFESSRQRKGRMIDLYNTFTSKLKKAVCDSFDQEFIIIPGQTPRITQSIWRERWRAVAPKIGMFDVPRGLVSGEHRERLKAEFNSAVEELIEEQMGKWADKLSQDLVPIFEEFQGELEVSVSDFRKGLDALMDQFIAKAAPDVSRVDPTRSEENWKRVLQSIIGIVTLDPNQILGSLYAPGWRSFLRRLAIQVAALVFLPAAVILVIILEFVGTLLLDKSLGTRGLHNAIADKIHAVFQDQASEVRDGIRQKLDDYSQKVCVDLENLLDNEIESRERVTVALLEQQRSGNEGAEISRLSEIDACLTEQWEAISQLVYGEVVPEDATRPGGNVSDAADPVG